MFTVLHRYFSLTHAHIDAYILSLRCIAVASVVIALISLSICLYLKTALRASDAR
jgi:hypothetical protein